MMADRCRAGIPVHRVHETIERLLAALDRPGRLDLHLVRQRQSLAAGPIECAQPQFAAADSVEEEYCQQNAAAVRRGLGADHGAGALVVAQCRVEDRGARRRRRLTAAVETEHAALEFAEIMHARDHLLPGVTALLEADAAKQVEVEHLRHEGVRALGIDAGDTGVDVEAIPCARAARRGLLREPLPERPQFIDSPDQFETRAGARHSQDSDVVALCAAGDGSGQCATQCHAQSPIALRIGITDVYPVARRLERDLAHQYVFAQTVYRWFEQGGRQEEAIRLTAAEEAHDRERAALGAAIGAELAAAAVELTYVVGELALQKFSRIGAVCADDGLVREVRDARAVRDGAAFVRGIAEMLHRAVFDDGAVLRELGLLIGLHGGSPVKNFVGADDMRGVQARSWDRSSEPIDDHARRQRRALRYSIAGAMTSISLDPLHSWARDIILIAGMQGYHGVYA